MNDAQAIEVQSALLQSVAEVWPDDHIAPSLTIAFLKKDGAYYASIVRYNVRDARGQVISKKVEMSTRAKTLVDAVELISSMLVARFKGTSAPRPETETGWLGMKTEDTIIEDELRGDCEKNDFSGNE